MKKGKSKGKEGCKNVENVIKWHICFLSRIIKVNVM